MFKDHPWQEILASMAEHARQGHDTYQKYTCSGCGARLGMEEPNFIYTHGSCNECPAITDIEKQGCNFMLMMPGRSGRRQVTIVRST